MQCALCCINSRYHLHYERGTCTADGRTRVRYITAEAVHAAAANPSHYLNKKRNETKKREREREFELLSALHFSEREEGEGGGRSCSYFFFCTRRRSSHYRHHHHHHNHHHHHQWRFGGGECLCVYM